VVEAALAEIWAGVLGVEQVGIHDNFFELGGDSILSIQVVARASEHGIGLNPRQLFQYQNIAELAAVVGELVESSEQGVVSGAVPLTPIQRWLLEQPVSGHDHYNQAMLLQVDRRISLEQIEKALGAVLRHHDALRMQFMQQDGAWRQFNNAEVGTAGLVRVLDLREARAEQVGAQWEAAAAEAQASLSLQAGQLVRGLWLQPPEGETVRLLIIVHHMVVDGVSWRILLDDLNRVCEQLASGQQVRLPLKTTSLQQWARQMETFTAAGGFDHEQPYWVGVGQARLKPMPMDYAEGANNIGTQQSVDLELSEEQTEGLVYSATQVHKLGLRDVLLTALAQTLTEWTGQGAVRVDVEGHGREEMIAGVDLTRTVGWFTSLYPVLLETELGWSSETALAHVSRYLAQVPNQGIGYGWLRSKSEEMARTVAPATPAQISFNYLGQFQAGPAQAALLRPTGGAMGPLHGLRGSRPHLLEVTGILTGRRLRFHWIHNAACHQRSTITALANTFRQRLASFIPQSNVQLSNEPAARATVVASLGGPPPDRSYSA
jgi:non-ribosomal peptide synthase protein (TIGR01720 family)